MGRPKKSPPAPNEPEAESREILNGAATEPGSASGKAISKVAAVRHALTQGEASPDDGVRYIKRIHGIDISKQMFSSYTAQAKARVAKKVGSTSNKPEVAERGRKPKGVSEAVEGYVGPPTLPRSPGEPDILLAIESVKELLDQYGVDKVRRFVDLLA